MVGSTIRMSATLALAVASLGCSPADRSLPATAPVRLVDELSAAEIRSPLLDVPPLASFLEELAPPRGEDGQAALCPQCMGHGNAGCAEDSDGSLVCGEASDHFGAQFELPIRSRAATAILVDARLRQPGCVGIEIRDEAQRQRMTLPNGSTERQIVPVIWEPASRASRVHVSLFRHRVAELCQLTLHSLSMVELEDDRELSLALLRDRHVTLASDPGPGFAKFGIFLPLSDAETAVAPFDDNYAAREALLAPVPTDIRFRLRVPHGSSLAFSYGLSRESRVGDQVEFEIVVTGRNGFETSLWSDQLELTNESWHWHKATVPLDGYWDKTVELLLRTRTPGARDPAAADGRAGNDRPRSGQQLGGLALWGTPTIDVMRKPTDRPNVVLIAVDTLRADRLSAYGYHQGSSPRIDDLARDGVLFENAISQSNWTLPAFASIFTGQIVARHQLATFVKRLSPGTRTLPELFRQHGWRTTAFLYQPALYQRLDRGFETFFNVPRLNARADENLQKAAEWLSSARDQRFFLFLHFQDPHQPFTHPDEFVSMKSAAGLRSLGLQLPLFLPTEYPKCALCTREGRATDRARALAHGLYDEEIRYVDDRIGRFVDMLQELGLYDDSVIVLVSDHGETLWDRYDFYGHGGANLHSELIRVPLIIKPPAGPGYRRGERVQARVRAFDLMPTLLQLAEIPTRKDDLDAESLLSLLLAEESSNDAVDRITFTQSTASAAFLVDRWKYIFPLGRGTDPAAPGNPRLEGELLYDLREDPGEIHDLSEDRPELLRSMREKALSYLLRTVGGRFLVVRSAPIRSKQRLAVMCEPACSWDPLLQFGLERTGTAAGAEIFEGPGLGGGIVLMARLAAGQPATVRLSWPGGGENEIPLKINETARFEEAIAGQLFHSAGPGAWILEAPARVSSAAASTASLDPRQEKALRALGYLD